jgi:hypothetical protein
MESMETVKNIKYIFLLGLLSFPVLGAEKGECAKVSYIPFYINLYGAETESSIERRAMYRQLITSSALLSIIKEAPSSQLKGYMADNSRVVIHFYEGDVFIDAGGRMRKGDRYADIDMDRFERVLTDKCPKEQD